MVAFIIMVVRRLTGAYFWRHPKRLKANELLLLAGSRKPNPEEFKPRDYSKKNNASRYRRNVEKSGKRVLSTEQKRRHAMFERSNRLWRLDQQRCTNFRRLKKPRGLRLISDMHWAVWKPGFSRKFYVDPDGYTLIGARCWCVPPGPGPRKALMRGTILDDLPQV